MERIELDEKAHKKAEIAFVAERNPFIGLRKAIAVYMAALPPAAPDGWKLVPVEATRAMWQAGIQHELDREHGKIADRYMYFSKIWSAMLNAAPEHKP